MPINAMYPRQSSRTIASCATLWLGLAISAGPISGTTTCSLLHPTPAAQMREMSTDRPDTTESPYTVDAGHYQIEMSFFDYSRDMDRGEGAEAWSFGQINLKAGLLPNTDLQIVFDAHTRERTIGAGASDTSSGFSDVTLRLKQNFWGNDGGKTAFAVMPYLKVPTGTALSNDHWEGGLILPLAVELADNISLGLMAEGDFVYDSESSGYDMEWVHSATLGIGLTEHFAMYAELVGIAGENTDYRAYFNSGVTLAATDNLCFDTGVRIGLNRAAENVGVFAGMSIRF